MFFLTVVLLWERERKMMERPLVTMPSVSDLAHESATLEVNRERERGHADINWANKIIPK